MSQTAYKSSTKMQTSTTDSTALPEMQIYRNDLPGFPNRASGPGNLRQILFGQTSLSSCGRINSLTELRLNEVYVRTAAIQQNHDEGERGFSLSDGEIICSTDTIVAQVQVVWS